MESVAIFPVHGAGGEAVYRAVSRSGSSEGRTAGEALDAACATLTAELAPTIVVIQPFDYIEAADVSAPRLFHPRRDEWSDHFSISEGELIVGASQIGCTTVERLRLNTEMQLQARRLWRQLGLFPG